MKALIVSDNHGDRDVLRELKSLYQNDVDVMIHCGDSELKETASEMTGFVGVKGNCDWEGNYPKDLVVEWGVHKILVTHGHVYNVKMSLMNLSYKAREVGATIACFGHSHQLGAEIIDGVLFVNPGSILMPRGRTEKTYAFLTSVDEKLVVQFYDRNHKELVELTTEFNLK
ncbi:metallophosphatase [Bacillus coahuilensis p1.1.43]|uniref:Phosphoesterase n=1 Tax=Bacillus coahuilensis p1.1.43 TaxID=1150625 RepID=A0A147K7A5_9BACI|nr:metallophosphoesterase [Bacillus coahuilensis]KUP05902.1 metallophosphatase [Bacillus coahuilensis p1.1.43]